MIASPTFSTYEEPNWELIEANSKLSVPEKNERAFAAAAFTLRLKKLILAEEHPDWSEAEVEKEARQIVFDANEELV